MEIVGYSDRFSVRPGETIRFMVSCELPTYRADIVRLIHGDPSPKGPGLKEELIDTPVSGEYTGEKQAIYGGSYVTVPDSAALRPGGSFTIQAWIHPTTPDKGRQGIVTKWSADERRGYALVIEEGGHLALWLGDDDGRVESIETGKALRSTEWYFVAASYDGDTGVARLYQERSGTWPLDASSAVVERATQVGAVGESDAPLIMAGYWDRGESGRAVVAGHFNGKIDGPRMFGRALGRGEIEALRKGADPASFGPDLLAAWDMAAEVSTTTVLDTGPHRLHGVAVNIPTRAVTGHNWKGEEADFKRAPAQYGAIYFHDDDIEDAGWEAGFELTVPEDIRSAVYAARLRTGDSEDRVPFFVRPSTGQATAPVALLAPTTTYMAYGNEHKPDLSEDFMPNARMDLHPDETRYMVENGLNSMYDRHRDGDGVGYVTRLAPILNMRPNFIYRGRGGVHGFAADLFIVDWMEAKGHEFDVLTDEDLHADGVELLAPYKVIITGTHPEYWSREMLEAMEAYLAGGGRLMYMGGNGFYWVTSYDQERPHIIEIRRWGGTETWKAEPGEYYHSTSGELGGLWRKRGKIPQKMVGVGFTAQGFDKNSPYRRQPGSFDPRAAFIFEGIGDDEIIGDFENLVLNHGAAGDELDRADYDLGTPPHALVLATSFGHSDYYTHVIEEVGVMDSHQTGTKSPLVKSDMVYFENPNGGAVFSVGSISWCGCLSYNGYDNNISRIMENVLTRFASDAWQPSA